MSGFRGPSQPWYTVAEFHYDALGRRVRGDFSDGMSSWMQHYFYDGQNVVAEQTSPAGPPERYFVHGPTYIDEHVLVHDVAADEDHYHLLRELTTVAGLADEDGKVAEAYRYDAYGRADLYNAIGQSIKFSAYGNPYFFTGRRLDRHDSFRAQPRLDLYHYRARAYNPLHGRFNQRDPAQYVDGMNLYEYVKSSPARAVDPLGSKTVTCMTRGFDGPPVIPLYHDWVPHRDPSNSVRSDQGGFDAFRIHWMKNSGTNMYFPARSSYSQWLDGTGTVKDMKLTLGDNIRLEALGNAKRLLHCDEKDVTCIRADWDAPFWESPFRYFGADWLSIGNLHLASYSICDISMECCIGRQDCTRYSANCHTVVVAWDSFHFDWPWKSFYWHATLQDHYIRGTQYGPPGCAESPQTRRIAGLP